ncbi:MAG TPA: Glu/Leu/Phe/Val dehydrogenase dimerization domain-containing protein [Geminicoccaceae bacterium]|nr:Glu/Leu/Phe/Val dehydrogenase dimerization domain-containing protein [Geminicoccaceae bacterium]
MDVFASPAFDEHEQVIFFFDPPSGLKAIVALHDTTLGPALGGCRMWPYPSEAEALTDVLRLAKGMTYKAAMAGLPFGGGKAVIIGDPRKDKSKALFRALGRAIESLGGRYYTGEDVGTTPADMDWAGAETAYVLGRSSGGSGDPSPVTARGVWLGIRAAVEHCLGHRDLDGIRVAVQGLGHVGYNVARLLAEDGARLIVADLDPTRAERAADEFGARPVDSDAIFQIEAEVLAPCALGGVINDDTVPRLTCRMVAGAANNQLLEPRHGAALRERGILYAPDYVINAGGLINIAEELRPTGYDRGRVLARVQTIGETLIEVFERAEQANEPTSEIADRLAEERLRKARQSGSKRAQRDVRPAREAAPDREVARLVAG